MDEPNLITIACSVSDRQISYSKAMCPLTSRGIGCNEVPEREILTASH
jgi:hypothetical protein